MSASLRTRALSLVLTLGLVLLPVACGGGGGGGGGGKGSSFKTVAGPSGTTLPGLNTAVSVSFSQDVDPGTVSLSTVSVVTINDPTGISSVPGGTLANASFAVTGKRVDIIPAVEFDEQVVSYGFVANALYEITFAEPVPGGGLRSMDGKTLTEASSYFFRTPDKAADTEPGFPEVRTFLVDDSSAVVLPQVNDGEGKDGQAFPVDGDLIPETLSYFGDPVEVGTSVTPLVPTSPVRDFLFVFDEAVLPQTVVNPVDNSSPSIRVLVNTAPGFGGGGSVFDPIIAPGAVSFVHQQGDLTVLRWQSDFAALPPDGFLLAQVSATVQDIACNSKLSTTGATAPLLSGPVRVEDVADPTEYDVLEPFDNNAQEDIQATSALWAESGSGVLAPVLGGGLGRDGPLIVDVNANPNSLGNTRLPIGATIDVEAKVVRLPSVRPGAPGRLEAYAWEFTSVRIPTGWTLELLTDRDQDGERDPEEYVVVSPGDPLNDLGAPLVLRSVGDVDVAGTIRANGVDGPVVALPGAPGDTSYLAQGGMGGSPTLAAGAGGAGAGVLLGRDTDADGDVDDVVLELVSPPVPPGALPFQPADPRTRGVTGRSTTLTATTLFDADRDLSVLTDPLLGQGGDPELFADLEAGLILLQPNVGVGSSQTGNAGSQNHLIDENHPTFVVESVEVVAGQSTITIVSDDGQSMVAPSKNVGTGYAPIATAGDPYLLGRFDGSTGGDVAGMGRGGAAAAGYTVVNVGALGVLTTGGAGGGGGGIEAGAPGESTGLASDPLVDQRGFSTGIAVPEAGGAPGGAGMARGMGIPRSDTEFDLDSQSAGIPIDELDPARLVGARLVPNAPDDGWAFRIVDYTAPRFTVERIQVDVLDIGLDDGPGASGPGLVIGVPVPFLILPPLGRGGAGGGGTGVSVTGTVNYLSSVLPVLTPGAGGASGGGSISIESARSVILRTGGRITAFGGQGGTIQSPFFIQAGGGGGGGGNVTLRAGDDVRLLQGSQVSVAGGLGGGQPGQGQGGTGGSGLLRFESFQDDLSASSYFGLTVPEVRGENLGRFASRPEGLGQSRYYNTQLANPDVERIVVSYTADTDGDDVVESLEWSFDANGPGGGAEGFLRPPFRFGFNTARVNASGFVDLSSQGLGFFPVYDAVSARTGLVYDPITDGLIYTVGQDATVVHGLGVFDTELPTQDMTGEDAVDIASMAINGEDEIFLLERFTGRVFVVDRGSGLLLRTLTLPSGIDGGMTYVADPFDRLGDRLVVAANRADLLVAFPTFDPDSERPGLSDFRPEPTGVWRVSRNGRLLDIELTGMSYDVERNSIWCLDAYDSRLYEVSLEEGLEGQSLSGSQVYTKVSRDGESVVLSTVTVVGDELHLTDARGATETLQIILDRDDVIAAGDDLVLTDPGVPLPEVSKNVALGRLFLKFQLAIDGEFDDPVHPDMPSFRTVRVAEVDFQIRNAPF